MLGKNFIHYYDDVDTVMGVLESGEASIRDASYAYEEAKRIGEQKIFFEESTQDEIDVTLEAAEGNVFTTIGKAVMAGFNAFKKFLEDFIKFVTDKLRGAETDKDKINKILKEHPDLKDQVVMSLEKGVLEYKDIATFEKDYLGLVQLLQSGKLDEQTFKDRARKAVEKFHNNAGVYVAAAGTVAGLVAILPKLVDAVSGAKNSIVRANQSMGKLKEEIDKNQIKDQGRLKATMSALKEYMGITTTEYKKQKTYADKVSGRLKWLANSKPAQWLDRKSADSQNKAFDRVKARENAKANEAESKYQASKSEKDREEADKRERELATQKAKDAQRLQSTKDQETAKTAEEKRRNALKEKEDRKKHSANYRHQRAINDENHWNQGRINQSKIDTEQEIQNLRAQNRH